MEIAIIGMGNELRGDDGLGPVVVTMMQKGALRDKADFYNLGLNLFNLPDLIRRYHLIFIIDALSPGPESGQVRVVHWQKKLIKRKDSFSLHDMDLLWQLEMASGFLQGDNCDIWLVGIRSASMDWNTDLSLEIKAKLQLILEEVEGKIEIVLGSKI